MPRMTDPRKNLAFALEKYPERTQVAPVEQLVIESARQNAKRPAWIKVAVPDELVKGLRGDKTTSDLLLLVQIPREVLDRSESRIVLPGEVRRS
jgi:hypothetical protein